MKTQNRISAIGYCRVSTTNQAEEGTIQIQKDAIAEYCNGHIKLVATFSDNGVSGGLENRLGLAEMFAFVESHPEIKTILVWKLDRLARDLYLQEHLIRKMESMCISLVSLKEPDLNSDDPMRKAFRQFMGIVAELEKSFITLRLRSGRLLKAKAGNYSGGGVPYGLVAAAGELHPNPLQVPILQEIFRIRINGHLSLGQIAKILNGRKVPTFRGGRWYSATIAYLLKNKRYRGQIEYAGENAYRRIWL